MGGAGGWGARRSRWRGGARGGSGEGAARATGEATGGGGVGGGRRGGGREGAGPKITGMAAGAGGNRRAKERQPRMRRSATEAEGGVGGVAGTAAGGRAGGRARARAAGRGRWPRMRRSAMEAEGPKNRGGARSQGGNRVRQGAGRGAWRGAQPGRRRTAGPAWCQSVPSFAASSRFLAIFAMVYADFAGYSRAGFPRPGETPGPPPPRCVKRGENGQKPARGPAGRGPPARRRLLRRGGRPAPGARTEPRAPR